MEQMIEGLDRRSQAGKKLVHLEKLKNKAKIRKINEKNEELIG